MSIFPSPGHLCNNRSPLGQPNQQRTPCDGVHGEEFVIVLSLVGAFGLPLAIIHTALRYRLKVKQAESASKEELEALRNEIAELRQDVRAHLSDLTLMLDDAMRQALPVGSIRKQKDTDGTPAEE